MSDRNLAHRVLGRYQLLVAVARGGMGQVWLGRLQGARGFNKLVAIKTLLPNEAERPRLEAMLAEEARLAALIHHANVVHTIELGEHEDLLYLVMEWVDGEPLGFLQARAAERGGMPLGVAVGLVSQVLAGLHAVHELSDDKGPLGVVHRDVSPHNILVTYDGVAKLLDFGIAQATEQPSSSGEHGDVKGKFSYMAPEQILGNAVDRRCDVFATGIVLYWLATGQHPFKHHNTAAVIHGITSAAPVPPPSSIVPEFPEAVERVVRKSLEKDRQNRYASAEEMRVALEQALPEAFGESGRVALRDFMASAIADRKAARREAVRRAQLAADGSDAGSGARALQSASSQSASSLGAISISQPAPEELPRSERAPRRIMAPQLPAPPPKAPWVAAGAGLLLALAAILPRVLDSPPPERASAASGAPTGAQASPINAPAAARLEPAASALPSASAPSLPAAASAALSAAKPSRRPAAKPPPPAPSSPSPRASADLLAPDLVE